MKKEKIIGIAISILIQQQSRESLMDFKKFLKNIVSVFKPVLNIFNRNEVPEPMFKT